MLRILPHKVARVLGILLIFSFIFSCSSLRTAIFDQYSYQRTVDIRVETEALLNNAVEPYTTYQDQAEALLLDARKVMEYEKHKPDNETTYRMWKLVLDPDSNLLAGLIKRWEAQTTLSPTFTNEAVSQVNKAMDLILKFEMKKDRQTKDSIVQLLSRS